MNQGLISQLGDPSLRAEFDLSAVESLRENENDRAKRRQTYVGAGIMTVDEVRREMGLGPVPQAQDAGAPDSDAGAEKGAVILGDIEAIRCDHDGLKMAEVQDGHLILRKKHHGQTHVKIVALSAFGAEQPQRTTHR